ncbi:MAG: insulinase family protein [Deltaproteobacteria bacterium]|nr:insulinase family protein [Deltaproteobacteria bacterium]
MNARLLSLGVAAALLGCGGSPAPAPRPAPGSQVTAVDATPPRPVDPEDAPLPLWSKIRHGKLANGLTYYVLQHKKPEKRAMLWLAVNAGAILEDDDQRGLAHFDEHMAFNGTVRFPKNEIIKYLETIGMRFGADLNAYTNFDETVYQLEVPTDKEEFVPKGFEILRDWAGGLTFAPDEVEKERGVVLEEWRLGRGWGQRLFDKNSKVLFKGSRYADRLTIGLPEVLKKAPVARLAQFYKDWYRPDLMAVIAVGDFADDAAIEAQIKATFGDLKGPDQPRPRVRAQVPKADGTRVSIATDHEMPSARVTIYNLLPHRSEASMRDLRRITAEQVYTTILNERLRTLGRSKDAPFTFASASVGGVTREIDGFTRSAGVKNHQVEEALRALVTEVVRVEKHGFSQSELDRAVANIAKQSEQSAIGEATTDGRSFTSEMTRHFFEGEFMLGRVGEHEKTMQVLPTITLADLNKLAAAFGGPANRVILVNGPDGKPLPTEQRVLAIVDEVAKAQIGPWEDKAVNVPLLATAPAPGKITKEGKIDAIGVTEWTLSNGARVIVKPTDFTADAVTIAGSSPGGLALASDAVFPHARFADDIVALGGAGELDAEMLRKVLAGKSASASASIHATTESLDGGGSVRDLETIFQLMYLRATAPRKDDAQIAVWRANTAEALANRRRAPDARFDLEAQEAIWKGHARRKPAEAADVEKIDADKAIAFWKDRFADFGDFTFVIVGAVDLAKVRPLVETYLASLPSKGRKEKEKDLGIRRAGGVVAKTWTLGTEPKAAVRRTYHADEAWTRDKERDAFVLSRVLAIRMRDTLREDLGGVYGVGAGGFLVRAPAGERLFTISFGCDPDRVDELIKAFEGVIADVGKNGASGELLDKVKRTFERERETALRTNGFWASWLSSAARYGDDPTLILDLNPTIARMTSDNVKASVKRFLDPKQYFQAVLKPARP